ncbi:hypothetical protein TNCV_5042311 [Trichonephila clavipes]|nr:hypothetical protein TNCV_5042311 [Trichonephila clavipes]
MASPPMLRSDAPGNQTKEQNFHLNNMRKAIEGDSYKRCTIKQDEGYLRRQLMRKISELASPLLTSTPRQRENVQPRQI